jgi:hypothetical protein
MLSRPSTLNWPHAPHSSAHPDFADTVYTGCPRCAPALRRLGDQRVVPCFHRLFLCRHVALKDPGKSIGCIHPVPSPMTLAFAPGLMGSALSTSHAPILLWGNQISGLYYGSHSLRPADLLASLVGADQGFPPSQPRLLLPGFRRIGHPLRRRI